MSSELIEEAHASLLYAFSELAFGAREEVPKGATSRTVLDCSSHK